MLQHSAAKLCNSINFRILLLAQVQDFLPNCHLITTLNVHVGHLSYSGLYALYRNPTM